VLPSTGASPGSRVREVQTEVITDWLCAKLEIADVGEEAEHLEREASVLGRRATPVIHDF
jgi:hypothetical protein